MYFGDAETLERHLHEDWNTLMRGLKEREELHLELLQYSRRVVAKKRDPDSITFIKDEINQHQKFLNEALVRDKEAAVVEEELVDKYSGCTSSEESICKLVARVAARILETSQTALDQVKALDEEATARHSKMKNSLLRLLKEKENVPIGQLIALIVVYAAAKIKDETNKLSKLIEALANGELEKLEYVYKPRTVAPRRDKEEERDTSVKREGKIKELKEEAKRQEQLKKQKQKLVTKLASALYSTMDLSRPQLADDLLGRPSKERCDRLYGEIFQRNKFNYEQIVAFEAKRDLFLEKVRLFREEMEASSRQIQEVLIRKPMSHKIECPELCTSLPDIVVEDNVEETAKNPESEFKTKIQEIKNRQQIPRSDRETMALRLTQANFLHIKFDASGQEVYPRTNRNRLPQIAINRTSAFEVRLETNRPRMFKEERSPQPKVAPRTNLLLKNVEVGVERTHHKDEKESHNSSSMEQTTYTRRSLNKFFEPRFHNIF